MPEMGLSMDKANEIRNTPRESRFFRRLRCRRGNAMVEFALCALPFFGMFLGIADVAFAVFLKNMLQSAVRDGVRFGVTYGLNYNSSGCANQTDCVKLVVRDNALGFLNGEKASLVQVKYYSPDNLTTPLTTANVGPGKFLANGEELLYVNQKGNLMEVSVVDFPWNWMVPLPKTWPGSNIKMTQHASDVLQGYPVGTNSPPPF